MKMIPENNLRTPRDPVLAQLIDTACSPVTLQAQASNRFALFRALVALHSNTSWETLQWIFQHETDEMVLGALGWNRNTYAYIVDTLACHKSEVVRAGTASSCKISFARLEQLRHDESPIVRDVANRNKKG